MKITFTKGDATKPIGTDTKIIVHVCNDVGAWGGGFVLAVSKRWDEPESEYRNWFRNKEGGETETVKYGLVENSPNNAEEKTFKLGNVQFVKVSEDIWVANMIGQKGVSSDADGRPPVRYEAIAECLKKVVHFAKSENASVHMPRIGSGLAGGKWEKIEEIIDRELIAQQVETTVYDFN